MKQASAFSATVIDYKNYGRACIMKCAHVMQMCDQNGLMCLKTLTICVFLTEVVTRSPFQAVLIVPTIALLSLAFPFLIPSYTWAPR